MPAVQSPMFACLILMGFAGCSPIQTDPNDPANRAIHYRRGQSEAELIRDLGPPTRERRLADGPLSDMCDSPMFLTTYPELGATERELLYELKAVGFDKVILDTFRLSTGDFTVVCVDKDRRITGVYQEIVH
jgi:hypothetical protein